MQIENKNIVNSAEVSPDNPVNGVTQNKTLPRIIERSYNENGKLKSMTILVHQEKTPLTGRQFAQFFLQKGLTKAAK